MTVKQQKYSSRRAAIFCSKVKTSCLYMLLLEAAEPAGAATLMLDCLRRPFFYSEAAAVLGTSYLLAPRLTLKNIARWFKDFLQCNKNSYLNLSIQSVANIASEGLLPFLVPA